MVCISFEVVHFKMFCIKIFKKKILYFSGVCNVIHVEQMTQAQTVTGLRVSLSVVRALHEQFVLYVRIVMGRVS